jgi:hypothetical protein
LACGFKEGLDGTDDLATGGAGFEHLPQETRFFFAPGPGPLRAPVAPTLCAVLDQ